MTYLFFIQGEGRGHLTQALTLKEKLESRGHRVLAAVIGANPEIILPAFFTAQIKVPLLIVASPGFVVDKEGRGIRIMASAARALRQLPEYRASLRSIKQTIKRYQPDALVSFYEPLVGQYYRLSRDRRPLFCFGHQYFLDSPAFKFPAGHILSRQAIKLYNRLAAPRRSVRIALSFTRAADAPGRNLFICPPLIRTAIKRQIPTDDGFLLIYLLNAGYGRDIISWGREHADVKIEAFWNKPEQETSRFGDNLIFHHLSGDKFIDRLAHCRAFMATAGFDSIAEAAYLQKDILMVPTEHHFEQRCNAVDAVRAGIATTTDSFNPSRLWDQTKTHSSSGLAAFKQWVDDYDDKIAGLLERRAEGSAPPAPSV